MKLRYTKREMKHMAFVATQPSLLLSEDWIAQDAELERLKHVCDLWHEKVNGRDGWANRFERVREAAAAVLDRFDEHDDMTLELQAMRIVAGIKAPPQDGDAKPKCTDCRSFVKCRQGLCDLHCDECTRDCEHRDRHHPCPDFIADDGDENPPQVITEITPTTGRDSFDCTPQQYHARLDMLWAAIPEITAAGVDDVFTLVVGRIESLTEASAAVVEEWNPLWDTAAWKREFNGLIEVLRRVAGIKAPPQDGDAGDRADEAYERIGDR